MYRHTCDTHTLTHTCPNARMTTCCILCNEWVWQCMQHGPEWVTVTYQITSLLLKRAFIINLQWSLFYICLFMWQHYMTVVMFVCVCVFLTVVGVRLRRASVCYKDRLVPPSRRRHYDDCHGDGVWVTGGITCASRGAGSPNRPTPWH